MSTRSESLLNEIAAGFCSEIRSSWNTGTDDNLWGAGQVIVLLRDVLPDQLTGDARPHSCYHIEGWRKYISVRVFLGWERDGADAGQAGTGGDKGRLGMKHTAGMGGKGQAIDMLRSAQARAKCRCAAVKDGDKL